MADREKILRYFKAGGDEELAAKLLDIAENARKSRKYRITDFWTRTATTWRKLSPPTTIT